MRFWASESVKALGREARRAKTGSAWKDYLKALREDRQQWQEQRLESAAYDWTTYKDILLAFANISSRHIATQGWRISMNSCRG